MSNLIINPQGKTLGSRRREESFVDTLLGSLTNDINNDPSNPLLVNEEGKPLPDRSRGLRIDTPDKVLAVLRDFPGFDVIVWMESDADVCLQIFPPGEYAEFADMQLLGDTLNDCFAQVFRQSCQAMCQTYEHRRGHRVALHMNDSLQGMDLFVLRLVGLYRFPERIWVSALPSALRKSSEGYMAALADRYDD